MATTQTRRKPAPLALVRGSVRLLLLVCASECALSPGPTHAARKDPLLASYTLRIEVHWGEKKNREAYREELQRSVAAAVAQKGCFKEVIDGSKADLVLDIHLNDLVTEQEYDSPEAILPGQGDVHELRAARANVNLDYRLFSEHAPDRDLLEGRYVREFARERQAPVDPVEERALRDLMADVGRRVAHELCESSGRITAKLGEKKERSPK